MSIAAVTIGSATSLCGIMLMVFGYVPSGTITTATGLVSHTVSSKLLRLNSLTNDRLDEIVDDLEIDK